MTSGLSHIVPPKATPVGPTLPLMRSGLLPGPPLHGPAEVLAPSRQNIDSGTVLLNAGLPKPLLTSGGVKRRLGMGRGTGGFPNKKFKPPTLPTQ
ncbi:hypothetical protein C8R44DRAFT_159246 [Mycena epipterygia]|nr:hypothetical protein C8R44DRAFT_159246 [Mycena epipterygia]